MPLQGGVHWWLMACKQPVRRVGPVRPEVESTGACDASSCTTITTIRTSSLFDDGGVRLQGGRSLTGSTLKGRPIYRGAPTDALFAGSDDGGGVLRGFRFVDVVYAVDTVEPGRG